MHGEVDHIQPRAQEDVHGLHVYDPSNLQYLCQSCHTTKTNGERRGKARGPGEDTGRTLAARPPRRTNVRGREQFIAAAGIPEISDGKRNPKC
ncbi:HNH endonuclease [Leisingera aquaemixtae]|uniref:HNH endonuclease n=2 Tax=Roseobacteraceae TaxID=2854170 RepID=UPI003B8A8F0D